MRQTIIIMGGVVSLTISLASFAEGQCMSTGTFAVDTAALQSTITQNCGGATNLYVGELYTNTDNTQGVIIYLGGGSTVGARPGLEVALTDDIPTSGIVWTNITSNLAGAQYSGLFSTNIPTLTFAGLTNTNAILASDDCNTAPLHAHCAAYQAATRHNTLPSTSGWYLPSQTELLIVWGLDGYNNSNAATTHYQALTTGGNDCYWSSTAYYTPAAYPQPFPIPTPGATAPNAWALVTTTGNSGGMSNYAKLLTPCGVRAVRAFTY